MTGWKKSWKLSQQAAEAGLVVVNSDIFDIAQFTGYSLAGHRGYGGRFPIGEAVTYTLQQSPADGHAATEYKYQAPLFVNEVHVIADITIDEIPSLEAAAEKAVKRICSEHGSWGSEIVWSVNLIDIYACPRTGEISHTLQISYCSKFVPLGRNRTDEIGKRVESELPKLLQLRSVPSVE